MSAHETSPPRGRLPQGEVTRRLVSGFVMAGVTLGALWLGAWPFGLLVALLATVASWEWGRLVRGRDFDGYTVFHALVTMLSGLAAMAGYAVPAALALVVAAIVLIVMRLWSRDQLTGIGVLAIGLPAVCLAHLRTDEPVGLGAVLFLFAVVWATDIGGYVFGRSIGGPRLWPSISPGKTWAGAIGGLLLAGAVGLATARFAGNRDVIGTLLAALLMGFAAEYGDLAESALKRRFGRKDASALIPGHGGLLDRIDGLLAAALVATVLAMLRSPMHPAAGLLLWP